MVAEVVEVSGQLPTAGRNRHYRTNREPLLASPLAKLPLGAVHPRGWLREALVQQRDGMTGHLDEISRWLQRAGNAWLNPRGRGRWGWEELPYWLRGFISLTRLLDDEAGMARARFWVEAMLSHQRRDGDFGPARLNENGTRDHWSNMVALYCLRSYYETSADPRVLRLMERYFELLGRTPESDLLTGRWERVRGGDLLDSVLWLFNQTGDRALLDLAARVHERTADWSSARSLASLHNVDVAQGFREPATFYQLAGDPSLLHATRWAFDEVRRQFGDVPGGMFGGDEQCRQGCDDPRQCIETCAIVEQMFSDQRLLAITGDPWWADHCEEVALNLLPAAFMPDYRGLRYLTAANHVVSDAADHAPGVNNSGPFMLMNPLSHRCCQHNHSFGWPSFAEHTFMATTDDGVAVTLYAPSDAQVLVADGRRVTLALETRYPFRESGDVRVSGGDGPTRFPLYLRIPAWCAKPRIVIDGQARELAGAAGRFVRVVGTWRPGDSISFEFPMTAGLVSRPGARGWVSVVRGPLAYSLEIGEEYSTVDSRATALRDSRWIRNVDAKAWPAHEIHPKGAWNIGIPRGCSSFRAVEAEWPADDRPFSLSGTPVAVVTEGIRIPGWGVDRYGLCQVIPREPAGASEGPREIRLVPMGAARLRISAFPVVAPRELEAGSHE